MPSLNTSEISELIIGILILIGALFSLLGALGIVRLPDFYTRSHAATKTATMGVICILLGTFLFFWLVLNQVNILPLLGIVFVFVTAPVGGHLIGRAAYRTNIPLWEKTVKDDLKHSEKAGIE